LEGFYVNIDADRAEEHPRVFSHVEVEYVFRGNLDPKAVEDAVRLSQEKYCSVSAMVGARATVSYRIRIENGE
jgi:putative redox protein